MTGDGFRDGHEVESDVVVRTALELLPIPSHDDAFWIRLEAALDAEPPLEVPVEPVRRILVADPTPAPGPGSTIPVVELERDTSLAVVPPAFRRTSNAVLLALAAAAVVVVSIAGVTLVERRGGTASSGDDDTATEALDTLLKDAQPGGGTVTTMSADHEDASSEAVLTWVDDLGAGDAQAAWEAMGPTSQSHFGTQAEFETLMADLAEGYGAWSAAEPDDVLVTPVAASDESTVAVVTLLAPDATDAFPVRIVDGDVVLEPFAPAGDLEVVIPELASDEGIEREPVGLDEELVFVLPSGAEAPVLRIDGADTVVCGEAEGTELSDLDQASGQRCAYLPEGGFTAGEHTVTIAFLGSDGDSVTAESLRFVAA